MNYDNFRFDLIGMHSVLGGDAFADAFESLDWMTSAFSQILLSKLLYGKSILEDAEHQEQLTEVKQLLGIQ